MKKVLIVLLGLFMFYGGKNLVNASNSHTNFEKIQLSKGKLLVDYTESDLKSYYKKVKKTKFSGWRTETINNRVEASFIDRSIFSYYNDGYTAMDYTYKMEEQETSKYSFSSNGSISVTNNKNGTGFKNGLDGSLKLAYSTDKNKTRKESYDVKVKVDPGTQVNLYIEGTGRLTNGVGARYLFWIRTDKGGFEVFEISSSCTRLDKIRI